MNKQVNEGLEYFWLFVGIALLIILFNGEPDVGDAIRAYALREAGLSEPSQEPKP